MRGIVHALIVLPLFTAAAVAQPALPIKPWFYDCERIVSGKPRTVGTIDIMADGTYRDPNGVKGTWKLESKEFVRFIGGTFDKLRARAAAGEKDALSFPAASGRSAFACQHQ